MEIVCRSMEISLCATSIYHRCTNKMRTINTILTLPISTKYVFHSEIFFGRFNKIRPLNKWDFLRKPREKPINSSYEKNEESLEVHKLFDNFPHISHHRKRKSREEITTGRNESMQIPKFISEKSYVETDNKIGHDSNGQFSSPWCLPCFVIFDTSIARFDFSETRFNSFFHKKKLKMIN